jgi:8-oxo-dGTP diphosphatase
VTVFLVRHARAGDRRRWKGPDSKRPLSKVGRQQADGLVDLVLRELGDARLGHLVSSPFVRCRQTLEPLAHRLDLAVDLSSELAEGARVNGALRLVEKLADEPSILCTHGDVLGALLEHYAAMGIEVPSERREKGSLWAIDLVDSQVEAIRYFPAPR